MLNCAKLAANLAMGSCKITAPGLKGEVVLINFDDWQQATITKEGDIITSIVLAGTAKGVLLTSREKAFDGSSTLNKGTYANSFAHSLVLRAFDRTQEVKDALNTIAHGRFVAIVHNIDKSDVRTAFEVYGAENGLLANAIEQNTTDGDNVIAAVTLGSDDAQRESQVPASFAAKLQNAYDYSTTYTAFLALAAADE